MGLRGASLGQVGRGTRYWGGGTEKGCPNTDRETVTNVSGAHLKKSLPKWEVDWGLIGIKRAARTGFL